MTTPQQAEEIRLHLIKELESTGYGDIVREVTTKIEENFEEENFQRNSQYILDFFLSQTIEVFESLSNSKYELLLARLNRYIVVENSKIEGITVELLNQGEKTYFDLSELPNYSNIIFELKDILNEIRLEN
jgi:hypothetical protein